MDSVTVEMHQLNVAEENSSTTDSAEKNTSTTPPSPPNTESTVGTLEYGKSYILTVANGNGNVFASTRHLMKLNSDPNEIPFSLTFVKISGEHDDNNVRVGDIFTIHSMAGLLHGYDTSVWIGWSDASNRSHFSIHVNGATSGDIVTTDTTFEIGSGHDYWKDTRIGVFTDNTHLGLAKPGTYYRSVGHAIQSAQFKATESTTKLRIFFQRNIHIVDIPSSQSSVHDLKVAVSEQIEPRMEPVAIDILLQAPGEAKAKYLAEDKSVWKMMPFYGKVRVLPNRGVAKQPPKGYKVALRHFHGKNSM